MTILTLNENTADELREFHSKGGSIIGVDVDTQHDFVHPHGALYVPSVSQVEANITALSSTLRTMIGSVDSHAFDAWEFHGNGGPFPPHCIKGSEGWLKVPYTRWEKMRFVPLSHNNLVIGEAVQGAGNRPYEPEQFAEEVLDQQVQTLFEKEVYSLFENPNAEPMIQELVTKAGGVRKVLFAVFGYCTGGYCVDAAAQGLQARGYQTAIVQDATAPIDGEAGAAKTVDMAGNDGIHLLQTNDVLQAIQ